MSSQPARLSEQQVNRERDRILARAAEQMAAGDVAAVR